MLLQNKVNRWQWYAYFSCNIMNCKSGISFNDFLYFWNDFFTRCKFWPTWFWCIFDGLYTRFKFIFPAPNCVIRHTRRSLSSRNFSHHLLQRTTLFWASFDVSPYFIFLVDASTNHFYYSGQWLCVLIWQILCLTFNLQRTTKFWASFDVSPYFIFLVDASTNHFYYSGQWLCVLIWQILCLTFNLTCTLIHRCVDLE